MEENAKEHQNDDEEELDMNDLLYESHLKIDALIDLLIKKNVITEEEYNKSYEDLLNEDIKEEENEEKQE